MEATQGKDWRCAARLGFLAGLVHFSTLLWWISPTISRYGSLPGWASWPVLGLLVCYLAVYPAVWSGLIGHWTAGRSGRPSPLALAGTWTLLEWIRGHAFSGFPWAYLAYSLEPAPCLIQTAEIWGPYGLTFLVVLLNAVLWQLWKSLRHNRSGDHSGVPAKRIQFACLILFLVFMAGMYPFGKWRMDKVAKADSRFPELRVAAIQGAVPQETKWDPDFQAETLRIYNRLSSAATTGQDNPKNGTGTPFRLLVWPETATPFYFQNPGPMSEEVRSVPQYFHVALLFGSLAYGLSSAGNAEYFNSVYLLAPDGAVAGRYDKRHLVPFGEYLPWGFLTAWLEGLVPAIGQYNSGSTARPICQQDLRVGVLICFESIFPTLSRETVLEKANFLAILTNDAWFGRTGAPYQHEVMAVFRAVETRRWVIRAANTGVSSIISPWGVRTAKTPLFEQSHIEGTIHLRKGHTLYVKYGETWFLLFCIFWLTVAFWKRIVGAGLKPAPTD